MFSKKVYIKVITSHFVPFVPFAFIIHFLRLLCWFTFVVEWAGFIKLKFHYCSRSHWLYFRIDLIHHEKSFGHNWPMLVWFLEYGNIPSLIYRLIGPEPVKASPPASKSLIGKYSQQTSFHTICDKCGDYQSAEHFLCLHHNKSQM